MKINQILKIIIIIINNHDKITVKCKYLKMSKL